MDQSLSLRVTSENFPLQNLLVMSGILILIAITTSGPWFLIALGGAVLLYGLILKLYLQTAQDLKRLEGISKFASHENFFGFSIPHEIFFFDFHNYDVGLLTSVEIIQTMLRR